MMTTGTQTENFDISRIVKKVLEEKIEKLKCFDTDELVEKLKRIDDENITLKRREQILEKRLLKLEKGNKELKVLFENMELPRLCANKSLSPRTTEKIRLYLKCKQQISKNETLQKIENNDKNACSSIDQKASRKHSLKDTLSRKTLKRQADTCNQSEPFSTKRKHKEEDYLKKMSLNSPPPLSKRKNNNSKVTTHNQVSSAEQLSNRSIFICSQHESFGVKNTACWNGNTDFCPTLFKSAIDKDNMLLREKIQKRDPLPTQKVSPMMNSSLNTIVDINHPSDSLPLAMSSAFHYNLTYGRPLEQSPLSNQEVPASSTVQQYLSEYPANTPVLYSQIPSNLNVHERHLFNQSLQHYSMYHLHNTVQRPYPVVKHQPLLFNQEHIPVFAKERPTKVRKPNVQLPVLTANISSDALGITLKWDCLNETIQFLENVESYILFAYHTADIGTLPPKDIFLWKRIGVIKPLPLPIVCTLTQSFDGYNYFVNVVPLDRNGVLGELSNPCAVRSTF